MLKRTFDGKIELPGVDYPLDYSIHQGPVSEADIKAVQKNPAAFLRKAGVTVPKDAEIHFERKLFGGPPTPSTGGGGTAAAAAAGRLCILLGIRIGRWIFIAIICGPRSGPMCW